MAPEGAVDYCIIHELSHLKHMDHSVAFWRLVGSRCPDYEKRKEELRVLNLRLMRENGEKTAVIGQYICSDRSRFYFIKPIDNGNKFHI